MSCEVKVLLRPGPWINFGVFDSYNCKDNCSELRISFDQVSATHTLDLTGSPILPQVMVFVIISFSGEVGISELIKQAVNNWWGIAVLGEEKIQERGEKKNMFKIESWRLGVIVI